jgi:CheY-like chemotaxis protein
MLGHELRNPLSAISSAATLLGLEGISMQKAATAKEIIQRQSGQLTRIVDDLLDLSRVMSGRIVLARKPLDLATLVQNCVDTLKISGRTEDYRIELDLAQTFIDADPARMEQVIVNLIDNALKYTPPGGRIDIRLQQLGDEVFFSVRDNGIGMSAELLPRIFDVFVQGERTLDRPQGGLGIGLSLVQQLVSLHDGEIAASSAGLGLGSEMTVRLPRSASQAAQPVESGFTAVSGRLRVLLIEDNIDGREIMAMRLSALGHDVFTAENGPLGIEIAEREKPDVVLLDIGLPEMDGFAVARALRGNPETCSLRLIALTGYGLEEDRIRSLEAGFDMHLVKPVDQERLARALARGVERQHTSR